MMLTALSEGVGSNWVGFMGLTEVKPPLGIPADLDVLAIIPFGYPAKPVGKGVENRSHFPKWFIASGSAIHFNNPTALRRTDKI
jgi:nitroreductase